MCMFFFSFVCLSVFSFFNSFFSFSYVPSPHLFFLFFLLFFSPLFTGCISTFDKSNNMAHGPPSKCILRHIGVLVCVVHGPPPIYGLYRSTWTTFKDTIVLNLRSAACTSRACEYIGYAFIQDPNIQCNLIEYI